MTNDAQVSIDYNQKMMESLDCEIQNKFNKFKKEILAIGEIQMRVYSQMYLGSNKHNDTLILTANFLLEPVMNQNIAMYFSSKIRKTGFNFEPYFGESGLCSKVGCLKHERSKENMIFRLVGKFINSI